MPLPFGLIEQNMGRPRVTDYRVGEDLATLKRMRKKSSIDFVQWTDDAASLLALTPRRKSGIQSTLHSVGGRVLAGLPDQILDRPVASLEFSIDFVAKLARSDAQQDADLIRTYTLLHRRLAPWKGRFSSTRLTRSDAPASNDLVISGNPLAGISPSGAHWFRHTPSRSIKGPKVISGDMRAHTVYFGHRPTPSWEGWDPHPGVQVRLYIKVTDKGKAIPRKLWRTRVEVTLNGPPLDNVLGVRSVRDLQTANMRLLVHEYLRLMSPREDPRLITAPGVPVHWKATVERGLHVKARHDVTGDYYEGIRKSRLDKMRGVLEAHASLASIPVSLTAHEAAFRSSVEESLGASGSTRQARLKTASKVPRKILATVQIYDRNPDVVAEVLTRAGGKCEGCGSPAPFKKKSNGDPYLEVHHKTQLATGGEDSIENAVALCPNCHRWHHYGESPQLGAI